MSETARPRGRHAAEPAVKARGRHREPDPVQDPTNILPLTGSQPVVGERKAAIGLERKLLLEAGAQHSTATKATAVAATTGLIMIGSMSGAVAHASTPKKVVAPDTESHALVLEADDPVITGPIVPVTHPRVAVETHAAPPPPPPPAPKPAPKPAPAPVVRPAAPAPVAPVVATPAPAVSATGKGSIIAYSALSQLGRIQDCTMLVTNALKAAGVSHHGWPISYLALGRQVPASQALPGDVIYYANGGMGVAHVAVYLGNGVAVHGGWNGNQTVTFSANVGSGPVFIRVA